ncbi:ankyrin repeat and KH domain-containing protein 1 [Biomphalaria pfeifferi]|uniref:Ankyrin repeat and KH domain-containing protein 1 n=1 Tax=Biomphalaria pfeifferi TaxID=112525 RepID=A0AAD8BBE5_BIOPF|nr:ankyrin repeat and KH domain-containing protein 1 [Biomphalaria pfeifferi]
MVQLLLQHGANVNAKDDVGNTPLTLASELFEDKYKSIKLLVDGGSQVNHRDCDGMSPLWFAAKNSNLISLKLLIAEKVLENDAWENESALSLVLNRWLTTDLTQRTA